MRTSRPASSVISTSWELCGIGAAWAEACALALARAVAQVEGGTLGVDRWQALEVVVRRRRAGRPLQAVALPGVVAGGCAVPQRPEDVPRDDEHGDRQQERPDRGRKVEP